MSSVNPVGATEFRRAAQFFGRALPDADFRPSIILVTHLLPDRPPFLNALRRFGDVAAIIPKPRSIHPPTYEQIREEFTVLPLTRGEIEAGSPAMDDLIDAIRGKRVIILDMGGYFAPVLDFVERADGLLLGVVEDTENGHQRYQKLHNHVGPSVPVFSVARSPLKEPEDYLVGQSVVFSAERLIRSCGQVLNGQEAVVFGYGKVGKSIAMVLQGKNVHTTVVEPDPLRAVEAMARGFTVISKREALRRANFLFCASGNQSLKSADFEEIRNGAFIASVTSRDDEIEFIPLVTSTTIADMCGGYSRTDIAPEITRFERLGQYFFLLNEGNAVNFLDGAVVGPYIYLVQAECLVAAHQLAMVEHPAGLLELSTELRRKIADAWLTSFVNA